MGFTLQPDTRSPTGLCLTRTGGVGSAAGTGAGLPTGSGHPNCGALTGPTPEETAATSLRADQLSATLTVRRQEERAEAFEAFASTFGTREPDRFTLRPRFEPMMAPVAPVASDEPSAALPALSPPPASVPVEPFRPDSASGGALGVGGILASIPTAIPLPVVAPELPDLTGLRPEIRELFLQEIADPDYPFDLRLPDGGLLTKGTPMGFFDSLTSGFDALGAAAGAAEGVGGALQTFGVLGNGGGGGGVPPGGPLPPAVGAGFFPPATAASGLVAPIVGTVAKTVALGAAGGLAANLLGFGDAQTGGFELVRGAGPHERAVFRQPTGDPRITPLREVDAIHPVTGKVITYRNKGRTILFADDLAAVKRVRRVHRILNSAFPKGRTTSRRRGRR